MNKTYYFDRLDKKTKHMKNVGSLDFIANSAEKAKLYFYGDIVSSTWETYFFEDGKCPQDIAEFLGDLDNYQAIEIHINSGGGSVHGGLAIYNLLRRYEGKKTTYVDGLAASIAGVIAMAGDEIIVPETAQIMLHKPWMDYCGNADDFRRAAESLDSCQETIIAAYLQRAKPDIGREQIEEMINAETWLTGKKAGDYFDVKVDTGEPMNQCVSEFFEQYKTPPVISEDGVLDEIQTDNQIERLRLELELL